MRVNLGTMSPSLAGDPRRRTCEAHQIDLYPEQSCPACWKESQTQSDQDENLTRYQLNRDFDQEEELNDDES